MEGGEQGSKGIDGLDREDHCARGGDNQGWRFRNLDRGCIGLELWNLGISGRDEDDFSVDLSDDTMCGAFTIMMGFVMISRTFAAICSSVTPYKASVIWEV